MIKSGFLVIVFILIHFGWLYNELSSLNSGNPDNDNPGYRSPEIVESGYMDPGAGNSGYPGPAVVNSNPGKTVNSNTGFKMSRITDDHPRSRRWAKKTGDQDRLHDSMKQRNCIMHITCPDASGNKPIGKQAYDRILLSDAWHIQYDGDGRDITLEDIHFINDQTGWAVGYYFDEDAFSNSGIIVTTSDGGENWSQQETGINVDEFYLELFSVYFVNEDYGWSTGYIHNGEQGHGVIMSTEDGGENWDHIITDHHIWHDVFFTDSQTGWIAGEARGEGTDFGVIWYTDDGGEQWVDQYSGENSYLFSVFFIDDETGWVVGDYFDDELDYGKILHTSDGGETWNEQESGTETDPGMWSVAELHDIHFTDISTGWAVGVYLDNVSDYGLILHTADGGQTWSEQFHNETYLYDGLYGVYFTDSANGRAVGFYSDGVIEGGLILNTTDGGSSWHHEFTDEDVRGIHFIDDYTGWITGDAIYHYRAEDTGTGDNIAVPEDLVLKQNYPNPFNPATQIRYSLPEPAEVTLEVFDPLGRKVSTLVHEHKQAGMHYTTFDASNLSSGNYMYRLTAGNRVLTRIMSFVK